MDYVIWSFVLSLLFIGLVGCIVPMLPGTTLILLGIVLLKLLLPVTLGWTIVGWIALIWLLSVLADFLGIIIGARMFGGSKWGMSGATGGALVGMFFSLPALLVGTFFGAVVAEKIGAKKTDRESLRAGVGATAGFLLSTVVRVACALLMLALFFTTVLTRSSVLPPP